MSTAGAVADPTARVRHAPGRALLIAPSAEFVASLPGAKIPDRRDFYTMPEAERMRRWQAVVDASEALGDELRALVQSGRIADRVQLWK